MCIYALCIEKMSQAVGVGVSKCIEAVILVQGISNGAFKILGNFEAWS